MARLPRIDQPGKWHHVINRGIARRALFEDKVDIRFFLSRIAREVRRGRLEVHAWCVLTTHFHLLVRSPKGELSDALRQIQTEYSRFFNRRHKRDGTLVRGRFFSKPVDSHVYRRVLVSYIDANAVQAGLVREAWMYPHCSAAQYASGRGPLWLNREWVESEVRTQFGEGKPFRASYLQAFGVGRGRGIQSLVESRTGLACSDMDELDHLVNGAPAQVKEWMRRKAKLADGGSVGLPVCEIGSVLWVIGEQVHEFGSWQVAPNGRTCDAWSIAKVGMLRNLARVPWKRIANEMGKSQTSCQRQLDLHSELFQGDVVYAERVARMAQQAIRRSCGL